MMSSVPGTKPPRLPTFQNGRSGDPAVDGFLSPASARLLTTNLHMASEPGVCLLLVVRCVGRGRGGPGDSLTAFPLCPEFTNFDIAHTGAVNQGSAYR
jgi:hypothetical protein